MASAGLDSLDPAHFDVVIIDEFHHAAADTYVELLTHLKPVELLGLTATPERVQRYGPSHCGDERAGPALAANARGLVGRQGGDEG